MVSEYYPFQPEPRSSFTSSYLMAASTSTSTFAKIAGTLKWALADHLIYCVTRKLCIYWRYKNNDNIGYEFAPVATVYWVMHPPTHTWIMVFLICTWKSVSSQANRTPAQWNSYCTNQKRIQEFRKGPQFYQKCRKNMDLLYKRVCQQ